MKMMKTMWVGICICLMAGYADGLVERASAEEVKYGVGNWPAFIENETYNELGNHRAVIQVDHAAPAVAVHIPWRRRDDAPQNIDVIIVSAKDEARIKNRLIVQASRESGDLVFEPMAGAGTYYAYYLPTLTPDDFYKRGFNVNHHFPLTRYVAPTHSADADWVVTYGGKIQSLPQARLERIESRTEFDSFYPMEVIATPSETEALKKNARNKAFVLFPESREFPIRMTEDLPLRWIKAGASNQFEGDALRNEYFAFQVGVFALKPVSGLRASFSDLVNSKGWKIPATALTCFNNGGTDWLDRDFSKTVDIPASRVQALWFGVDIADDIAAGTYRGKVVLTADNGVTETVDLIINVGEEHIADRGDSEIWRHSRLRWLNSDLGLDTDLVAPFTAVKYEKQTLSILGREMVLNELGLPQSVKSFIELSDIKDEGREVLAAPVRFDAVVDDKPIVFKSTGLKLEKQTPGKVELIAEGSWNKGSWKTDIIQEMDGYMRHRITFKADQDTTLKGAKLIIPMDKAVARYSKLSKAKGGSIAKGPKKASLGIGLFYNFAWMGDYNAGIACRPKNDADQWNGDNGTKSKTPVAKVWDNDGTGEYRIEEADGVVYLMVDSGDHTLKKGEEIRFNFALFITPFKPVRSDHWDFRYYHTLHGTTPKLQPAVEGGARYITAHHGSVQNPNINYPFLAADALRESTLAAKEEGLGQKIYYTVRELSVYTPELWALWSLGDEIIMPGNGYRELLEKPDAFKKSHFNRTGFPWSCEHLVSGYINRWHTFVDGDKNNYDASISVQGLSRWHNYYIEGLRWLLENTGISGIYLDGIGYDREIMKRLRKTLIRTNPDALIDYHSSSLIPVLEHMPYMDSVWIGEGANYDLDEDYWLIEVSGIPFGLSGETLKNDASPYRAMLYGMARRYGWSGGDPRALWKWWDAFDIKQSRTIGFWDDSCPAQTDHLRVRATAYVKSGKATAIALASWAEEPVEVLLELDWKALGLDPKTAHIYMPKIDRFQEERAEVSLKEPILVEPDKGIILVIDAHKE